MEVNAGWRERLEGLNTKRTFDRLARIKKYILVACIYAFSKEICTIIVYYIASAAMSLQSQ